MNVAQQIDQARQFLQMGQMHQAQDACRRALELDPTLDFAARALAELAA